jgi:MFS-type transporter involved in bile tolerance (Atg22 family)
MTKNIVNFSFLSYMVFTLIGAFMKLNHIEYSQMVMLIGIIALVVFVLLVIMEINNSSKIEGSEKMMWILGILFLSFFAGIVYVFSARKKII